MTAQAPAVNEANVSGYERFQLGRAGHKGYWLRKTSKDRYCDLQRSALKSTVIIEATGSEIGGGTVRTLMIGSVVDALT
ncbi:hypothetical protein CEXT_427091 [Caerostris extrusa]|uniref:Uncharacterized protein n=1 Tax=Caerostris extrusa TaxID=172846 RepID=A0AAV4TI69_CAEEX|nr:hypothetical protein CEXT_427091 [Caerostris extrusa]